MTSNRKAAFSRGDVMRRLDEVEDRQDRMETRRTLQSASIGAGGVRVLNGFIIILDAQGNETMRLSTDGLTLEGLLQVIGRIVVESSDGIEVLGGGSILVRDGGDIIVSTIQGSIQAQDGGAVLARWPNNEILGVFGDFDNVGTGGIEDGAGFLVQDDTGADILRAKVDDVGVSGVYVGAGTDAVDELITISDVLSISARNGGDALFGTVGGGSTQLVSSGDVILGPDETASLIARIPDTTGSSANLVCGAGVSTVARSTSAARFKQDVSDLTVDPAAVRKLRPRTWRDKGDVKRNPDTDRWHVGLVAEEVVEAGLAEFVEHDHDGVPDYVAYDRLTVALLSVLSDQEQRLQNLESRLAALDGQEHSSQVVTPTRLPLRCADPLAGRSLANFQDPPTVSETANTGR